MEMQDADAGGGHRVQDMGRSCRAPGADADLGWRVRDAAAGCRSWMREV